MAEVESALYESLQDGSARCNICERRCVIHEGGWGYCYTRKNREGRIYNVTYGEVSTKTVAPIEAKPIFHFLPGSRWLSLGGLGCNLRCIGCQNCVLACPFGAVFPQGEKRMVVKCDLCADRIGPGELPVCVRSCPAGALRYERLEDIAESKRELAAQNLLVTFGREPHDTPGGD